jgi:dihydroorotate dehydrogenase electron transfer subunit
MIESTAVIVSNRKVARGQNELVLRVKGLAGVAVLPGQFCMLSVDGPRGSRILRRPFSIFGRPGKDRVSVLFKVAGEGTSLLAKKKKGDLCSVLLPLGNGFPVDKLVKKHLTIVAGGIGAASVHSLLSVKSKSKKFFYGAGSGDELCPVCAPKSAETFVATLDGSRGHRGLVTDLVTRSVTKDLTLFKGEDLAVCACGPMAMLKALFHKVSRLDPSIQVYVSLEERMACGFGVCMGCVVATDKGYKRACADGPVFPADAVDWSRYP